MKELIYKSGIKDDINLEEVEEILFLIFDELDFDKYIIHINIAKIIETYHNLNNLRIGDIYVYLLNNYLLIEIEKGKDKETIKFPHKKPLNKFFISELKDLIKMRQKWTLLIDSLTSLPNRRYFFNELKELLKKSKKLAIVFLDIKGFKFINDLYGHEIGDSVLIITAERIKRALKNQFIARLGADEFVFVLSNKDRFEVEKFLKYLISILEEPIQIENLIIEISVNMGVALYPEDGTTKNDLLQAADLALFKAKLEENKPFVFFKKEFKEEFLKSKFLEKDILKALEKNELFLVYQPKVDSRNNKTVGVEALLRWRHPIYGILPNNLWIPIMENSRALKKIGLWVLKTALNDIEKFNKKTNSNLKVSINADIQELTEEYYLKEIEKLSKYQRSLLTIELLERKAVKYFEELARIIQHFKNLSVKFSFDDFGTGNTTLKYLTKILPDELKIDRSFVNNIHNSKTQLITKAIIAMARSLNIEVIAEGAETEDEVKTLQKLGCFIIQGFYYSKPIKIEELYKFIEKYPSIP